MNTKGKPTIPTNPRVLARIRTELLWEGTYGKRGNRREVNLAGSTVLMRKIKTVDQARSEAIGAEQSLV